MYMMSQSDIKELELYIHIPFCRRKCAYCDFLSFCAGDEVQQNYVEALTAEIEYAGRAAARQDARQLVTSIFIGGGTPSVLSPEQIGSIMSACENSFMLSRDAEISMECNPGTVDGKKLEGYRKSGINRISFGLQSAQDEELRLLGRIHSWEEFVSNYQLARSAGFENINVDLMSALPGQSISTWEDTLKKVLDLEPEHISAYSLIIEEGTPFYQKYHDDDLLRAAGEQPLYLPDEESERQMYEMTEQLLQAQGYHRYEISNYAREGYACRHNIGYWKRKDYLGFGIGAASLYKGVRYTNTQDIDAYIKEFLSAFEDIHEREQFRAAKDIHEQEVALQRIRENIQKLTKEEQIEETMFLGLRMMEGVSKEQFKKQFGAAMETVYGDTIQKLVQEELIEDTEHFVKLTRRGIDVSNVVMAEFLLEE